VLKQVYCIFKANAVEARSKLESLSQIYQLDYTPMVLF
jgi:hypothetical protein